MVLPLSAAGVTGVAKIEAIVDPQRLAGLEAQIRFLQALAPQAAGVTHVVPGGGAPYVVIKVGTEQVDDGPWGRRDVTETFSDLLQPILTAWQQQDYTQVGQLLAELRSKHSWWYEAFGWPPGQDAYELPTGSFGTPQQLQAALTAEGDMTVGKVAGVPGDALSLPGGSASLRWTPSAAGKYAITAWMLSGQGYGPVEVSVDGRPAGQLGVEEGAPYFAHFTLATPLALGPGPHTLAFRSQGAQGLVVSALEIAALPPEPIKQWSAIGLFDKGGTTNGFEGFNTVFPPEKEFNPQASYTGMGGQPVRWQQIDIGQDKFVQLLEKYFPYNYAVGNGVAYLASWVYSPDDREATLYYAFDWYSRVWVNDAVVVPQGSGPWGNFATTTIHLHAGWNKLLIKTACGRSSWKANLAVSDPGDLRYSPLPPG
jgi:hypothetical protein